MEPESENRDCGGAGLWCSAETLVAQSPQPPQPPPPSPRSWRPAAEILPHVRSAITLEQTS